MAIDLSCGRRTLGFIADVSGLAFNQRIDGQLFTEQICDDGDRGFLLVREGLHLVGAGNHLH